MKVTTPSVTSLTVAFALLASCPGFADDSAPRATGFIPSHNAATLRASMIANPKRDALLRATADPLPAQFDAREQGWITPIRDQAQVGSCWAFAAVATIETQLKTHYSTLFYETFGFGPLSGLVGTSGHSLWSRWMTTGFDPSISEDKEFTVSIDMSSGSPIITWDPDLGKSRTYKVFGRDALAPESPWREVDRDNPAANGARFFRVSVGQ